MNVKVGSLSDILTQVDAPVYVKDGGRITQIKQIRRAGSNIDVPDVTLLGSGKQVVGEFDDQRVKLCLETWVMTATNVCGRELTVGFGDPQKACVTS